MANPPAETIGQSVIAATIDLHLMDEKPVSEIRVFLVDLHIAGNIKGLFGKSIGNACRE